MGDAHQPPVQQLFQAVADVGARHAQRFSDVLGIERTAMEVEQGVNLGHSAVDAPGRAHFAPVDDEAARGVGEFHGVIVLYV